jgi:hypothetical protein
MQKKPGDGEQFVLGFVPETADSADSMRDPQGKEGFMGQLQPNPISFFLHKTLSRQAGRKALLQVTRIFEQERLKEGRKEMSDVHCTCVCLCLALVFSLLPLY